MNVGDAVDGDSAKVEFLKIRLHNHSERKHSGQSNSRLTVSVRRSRQLAAAGMRRYVGGG